MNDAGKENRNIVTKISSIQSKMARVALGWGVRELASAAKVSNDTVSRLERGEELKERTLDSIRRTFEAAGVEFLPDNGVRLRTGHPGTQNT